MTQLTSAGFSRSTMLQRLDEIYAKARLVFGQDIELSSDTMDGQHLAIFAEAVSELDDVLEMVWHSLDPDLATGQSLDRIVKLNNISRNLGAESEVLLTLTGTNGAFIPAQSVVSNGLVDVYTKTDVTIASGVATVQASTQKYRADNGAIGSFTTIKNPTFGWDTVTNNTAMVPGAARETDEQLRLRRRGSVSIYGRNVIDAIRAAILNLDGVAEVTLQNNTTNTPLANGLPAHSVHAVVVGGNDASIAQVLWARATAGVNYAGTTAVSVTDANGQVQPVKFSRPTLVRTRVRVEIVTGVGWTIGTTAKIKQAVYDWFVANIKSGDSVSFGALYTPINTVSGFTLTQQGVQLATGNNAFAEANINIAYTAKPTLDINDIVVVTV